MRRFLLISLGVHAVAALIALAILLAPHARDPRQVMADLPDNMTPVEVVRAPGADASPPPAPTPAPPTPPAEQAPPPTPPEPQADDGAPPSPPPEQKQAAATEPPPQPAPQTVEKPDMHVNLGAAGLTDDVEGEDMVSPGPDPSAQNIPPRYPRDAVMKGERGVVALLVKVSPIGTVDDVEVVRSSGFESLDEAARKAVLRWRFTPATEDGVAHESERVESFNFE